MNGVNSSAAIEQLLSIDTPPFCCGVILVDDRAIRAAPIVRYMVGWHRHDIERYGHVRGWRVDAVTFTGGKDESVGCT